VPRPALCYRRGEVERFGDAGQGLIIVPSPGVKRRPEPQVEEIAPEFRRFASMR
jgi:hypothetical protein